MGLFSRKDRKTTNERQQILEMLASGKISVAEAEKLLSAIGDASTVAGEVEPLRSIKRGKARFLRVAVSEDGSEKVNVKIPLQLLRAGVKLGSLIPENVQLKIDESMHEQGMQFSLRDLKPETVEELIDGLTEFEVNVNDDGDAVRVYCE